MNTTQGLTINHVYNMITTEGAVGMVQKGVSINDIQEKLIWTDRNWWDRYGVLELPENTDTTAFGEMSPAPWDWFATMPTGIPQITLDQAKAMQTDLDTFVRGQETSEQAVFLSKLGRWLDTLSSNLP